MKKYILKLVGKMGRSKLLTGIKGLGTKIRAGGLRAGRWIKRNPGKFSALLGGAAAVGTGAYIISQLGGDSEETPTSSQSKAPFGGCGSYEADLKLEQAVRAISANLWVLQAEKITPTNQYNVVELAHAIARAMAYCKNDDISVLFGNTLHDAINLAFAGLELQEKTHSATVLRDAINAAENPVGWDEVKERLSIVIDFAAKGTPLSQIN